MRDVNPKTLPTMTYVNSSHDFLLTFEGELAQQMPAILTQCILPFNRKVSYYAWQHHSNEIKTLIQQINNSKYLPFCLKN